MELLLGIIWRIGFLMVLIVFENNLSFFFWRVFCSCCFYNFLDLGFGLDVKEFVVFISVIIDYSCELKLFIKF